MGLCGGHVGHVWWVWFIGLGCVNVCVNNIIRRYEGVNVSVHTGAEGPNL